jgi:hypothetical protein
VAALNKLTYRSRLRHQLAKDVELLQALGEGKAKNALRKSIERDVIRLTVLSAPVTARQRYDLVYAFVFSGLGIIGPVALLSTELVAKPLLQVIGGGGMLLFAYGLHLAMSVFRDRNEARLRGLNEAEESVE